MLRFFLIFLGVLAALFAFEISHVGETWFVFPFTDGLAQFSAWLIKLFDSNVHSHGKIIQSTANGFAVSIERGCNGIEAVIILIAALAAFPSTLRQKLIGFGLGFVAIQVLNLVRIISLFYMGQWSMVWFEWFHLYLWQALIILDALVVWLVWLRWISKERRLSRHAATPATA
jgi:exosortase H (IPTLxxWG-CTERM-specific)